MKVIIAVLILLLAACDKFENHIYDCLNFDGPVFDDTNIPVAVLNEEYFSETTVSIVNDNYDDWYTYEFDFIGELPYGLEFVVDNDRRSIKIIGTPLQVGYYNFKINVKVSEPESPNDNQYYENTQIEDPFTEEPYDDGDDLCRSRQSKEFTLEVKAFTS